MDIQHTLSTFNETHMIGRSTPELVREHCRVAVFKRCEERKKPVSLLRHGSHLGEFCILHFALCMLSVCT